MIRKLIAASIYYIFMLLLAIIMFYPFIFSLLAGFTDSSQFTSLGNLLVIPQKFIYESYKSIFQSDLLKATLNTIGRTIWIVIYSTLFACLCGYVLARLNFPGKRLVVMYTLFLTMVPTSLTLVPNYIMASKFPFVGGNNWLGQGGHGLINNPLALYLILQPGMIIWTLFFQKSMSSIPVELDEAAYMDGAGFIRTLFRIILPTQKPIITVIVINSAINAWTDFATPFTYINDLKYTTLPGYAAVLTAMAQQFGTPNYPLLFAVATVATVPMLVILFIFQKYIVQGIASTGIKG